MNIICVHNTVGRVISCIFSSWLKACTGPNNWNSSETTGHKRQNIIPLLLWSNKIMLGSFEKLHIFLLLQLVWKETFSRPFPGPPCFVHCCQITYRKCNLSVFAPLTQHNFCAASHTSHRQWLAQLKLGCSHLPFCSRNYRVIRPWPCFQILSSWGRLRLKDGLLTSLLYMSQALRLLYPHNYLVLPPVEIKQLLYSLLSYIL